MTQPTPRRILIALALALVISGALIGTGLAASSRKQLVGTLALSPGKLVHGRYTGTYFRMLLPGATDKYFSNPVSRAKDHTYTLLRPGTGHGLELGRFQAPPKPAFSSTGSALASNITKPESFVGIKFSISTAPTDVQSGRKVSAPKLIVNGKKLTGDLSAWTAEWNRIYFNQGAPKPGGSYPGLTQPVTGAYNARTKAFTIVWYSAIVGGPFSGFTGFWHLQGKLKP